MSLRAQLEGKVTESLPNAMFRVELQPTSTVVRPAELLLPASVRILTPQLLQVLATISGKIRKNQVRIIVGDVVKVHTADPLSSPLIFPRSHHASCAACPPLLGGTLALRLDEGAHHF